MKPSYAKVGFDEASFYRPSVNRRERTAVCSTVGRARDFTNEKLRKVDWGGRVTPAILSYSFILRPDRSQNTPYFLRYAHSLAH